MPQKLAVPCLYRGRVGGLSGSGWRKEGIEEGVPTPTLRCVCFCRIHLRFVFSSFFHPHGLRLSRCPRCWRCPRGGAFCVCWVPRDRILCLGALQRFCPLPPALSHGCVFAPLHHPSSRALLCLFFGARTGPFMSPLLSNVLTVRSPPHVSPSHPCPKPTLLNLTRPPLPPPLCSDRGVDGNTRGGRCAATRLSRYRHRRSHQRGVQEATCSRPAAPDGGRATPRRRAGDRRPHPPPQGPGPRRVAGPRRELPGFRGRRSGSRARGFGRDSGVWAGEGRG